MKRIFGLLALGYIVWATPSFAQSGAVLCYTFANNAATTVNMPYTPPSGSTFVAVQGGTVSITHTGTGAYSVTCNGIGPGGLFNIQPLGAVLVTAVGDSNAECHTNSWFSGEFLKLGGGIVRAFNATVVCFGKGGGTGGGPAAADSEFTLVFIY
jgi:hypothetical protein